MTAPSRVLIAGVSNYWGRELASKLEFDPSIEYVGGLDTVSPERPLARAEFIRADLRNPLIGRLLPSIGPDTIVYSAFSPSPLASSRAIRDAVIPGTLQLLNACERCPSVRRIILCGSAAIYGAGVGSPSFFSEEMVSRSQPSLAPYQRDLVELEGYVDGYARRHPDTVCTVLRFQPAIGMEVDTSMTGYLGLPVVPTPLGCDPRLQLIHESDGVGALVAAVKRSVRGAVNVAASGTIGLTRLVRLAGKTSLPVAPGLLRPALAFASQTAGIELDADVMRILRYGRGVDTLRQTADLGFTPRLSTVKACEEFAWRTASRRLVGRRSGRPVADAA